MNLKKADIVRIDWGRFLEMINGTLMVIFLNKIPQSFLPYPKSDIREALNISCQYFTSIGNEEAVRVIKTTIPFLDFYINDEEALKLAAKKFTDENFLKAIVPELGDRQKKQLEFLEKHKK